MKKGAFDLDDLADQLKQLQKLGGMGGVMNLLPGMGKIKKQMEGLDLDNKVLKRQMAIIGSMTPYERRNPKVMDARRKKRVAAGSGTKVEEINRLLKMHLQMAAMMKQMGQGKGMFGKMMGGGKGAPDAAELETHAGGALEARPQRAAGGFERDDEGRLAAADAGASRPRRRESFPASADCRVWAADRPSRVCRVSARRSESISTRIKGDRPWPLR